MANQLETYGELAFVLLNQEISVLLSIELVPGGVIGHEVVVQVVIAAHSHEKYAFGKGLCYIRCSQIVCNSIKCVLEVLKLLIKRYSTNL